MRHSLIRRRLYLFLFISAMLLSLALQIFVPQQSNVATAQSVESNNLVEQYVERVRSVTFSTMPPATDAGSIEIPDVGNIEWQTGQTPDEYLRLGTFYDSFNLQLLSFESVASWSGIDTGSLTLADISLFSSQNLGGLVSAIPDLGRWQVYQVPIFQDLLSGVYSDNTPWDELTLEQIVNQEGLGDIALSNLDLTQYGLDAIPGLLQSPLGRLEGWSETLISQIPGLRDVPFAAFPGAPSGAGYVALFDVTYGHKEAQRLNTITGSYEEGFEVPCDQDSCSYIELSGPPWLNAEALHGKQWIKGGTESDAQMVRGGSGILGMVNNGMEPTGRHPYGRGFKVVLRDTNESEGSAKFALYFRYCRDLAGCSPYIIGPIPWFSNHEDDIIFVGLTQSAEASPDEPSHPGLPPNTQPPSYPPPTNPSDTSEPVDNSDDKKKGDCSGKLSHPAPGFPITSNFGMRVNPVTHRLRPHNGIDYGTPSGTAIRSADGGQVVHAGWMGGYGNTVDIKHCDGRLTRYAHLSEILVSNSAVSPRQVIGRAGTTGNSTGPHLHFEVHVNGAAVDPQTQLGR